MCALLWYPQGCSAPPWPCAVSSPLPCKPATLASIKMWPGRGRPTRSLPFSVTSWLPFPLPELQDSAKQICGHIGKSLLLSTSCCPTFSPTQEDARMACHPVGASPGVPSLSQHPLSACSMPGAGLLSRHPLRAHGIPGAGLLDLGSADTWGHRLCCGVLGNLPQSPILHGHQGRSALLPQKAAHLS